jgi:hypothetical protein
MIEILPSKFMNQWDYRYIDKSRVIGKKISHKKYIKLNILKNWMFA